MHTTPASLLSRLQQPNPEAWARFVDLYLPLLFSWARRLGVDEDEANDLIQDVFVTLLHRLPQFQSQGPGSFRAWLRTVVLNRWRDRCRRRQVQAARQAAVAVEELPAPDDSDPLGEAEYRRTLVRSALALLQNETPATTWRAFWEHGVCGRPASVVAKELGLTVNAVYLARMRVLRRLRRELEGMLD